MEIYIIEIVFLLFFALCKPPQKTKSNRLLFLLVSFFTLVFISGCRSSSVGCDTVVYCGLYCNIDTVDVINARWEPGFILFLKLLNFINNDPQFFLIVCSAINIGLYCHFLYYHSRDPLLSVMLYIMLQLYFSQMNLIRQELSVVLVITAFHFELNRRKLLPPIFIVVAGMFHYSAFVMLVPYLIWKFRKRLSILQKPLKKQIGFAVVLSVVVFVMFSIILQFVMLIFPFYSFYNISKWATSNYFACLLWYIVYLCFLIIGAVYIDKNNMDDNSKLSFLMIVISLSVYALSMRMVAFERLSSFFNVYCTAIWVPYFVNDVKDFRRRELLKMIILASGLILMLIILIFRPNWSGVVPYRFAY